MRLYTASALLRPTALKKLHNARARKGKEPIRPVMGIDVRASRQAAAQRRGDGIWTVRAQWRWGHLRRLQTVA